MIPNDRLAQWEHLARGNPMPDGLAADYAFHSMPRALIGLLVREVRRLSEVNEDICQDSVKEHNCLGTICGMLLDAGFATGEFHALHVPVAKVIVKLAEARKLLERAFGEVHRTDLMRAIERFLGIPEGTSDDS